jgi:hypothetical protein
MATYKVLQDIEAEDKLLGPLTFRQFVYAGACVFLFYLAFLTASKGFAIMAPMFILPGALFGFLAFPWRGEQPTEVWALAKVRFYVKPRKRIWNQTGIKELVTVTAPKQIDQHYTNGLSENEVRSRLKVLAATIDSRGWAIKNVNAATYNQPGFLNQGSSDRLVGVGSLPQPVADAQAPADMLDLQNNRVAQQFDTMMAASAKAHRQKIEEQLQNNTPAPVPPPPSPQQVQAPQNDYWFLNQPTQGAASVPQDAVTFNTQVVAPGSSTAALPVTAANPTEDEERFIKQLKNEPAFSPNMHGHLHVIQPLSAQKAAASRTVPQPGQMPGPGAGQQVGGPQAQTAMPPSGTQAAAMGQTAQKPAEPKVTQAPDPAIVELARNDDLNVATIAREAQKRKEPPDEVVISLH